MIMIGGKSDTLSEVDKLRKHLTALRSVVKQLDDGIYDIIYSAERAQKVLSTVELYKEYNPSASLSPGYALMSSHIYPTFYAGMVECGVLQNEQSSLGFINPEFINASYNKLVITAYTWPQAVHLCIATFDGNHSVLLRRRDRSVVECWFIPNNSERSVGDSTECVFAVYHPIKDDASSTQPPQSHHDPAPQSESPESEPAAKDPLPVPEKD